MEKLNYLLKNLDSLWGLICGEVNTDDGDAKLSELNV